MTDSAPEFRAIYHTFQPRILHYMMRLVGEHEAADVTQEVLVKVSQALKDFRNEASLSTWIYRIATNAALDKLRGRDFTRLHEGLPEDGDVTEIVDRNTWSGSETPPVDRQPIRP